MLLYNTCHLRVANKLPLSALERSSYTQQSELGLFKMGQSSNFWETAVSPVFRFSPRGSLVWVQSLLDRCHLTDFFVLGN